MEIEIVRSKKIELKDKISELVSEFEKETGVNVEYISTRRVEVQGAYDDKMILKEFIIKTEI